MSSNPKNIRKIFILCEGKTEEIYLKGLFDGFLPSSRYALNSTKKNSYKNFQYLIQRSEKLYDIFIVIMDLDRAKADETEYKHLEKLISVIKKRKNKSHIFLTHSNFEDWLRHHFKPPIKKEKLAEKLGCKDTGELKSKEDIFQIIQNTGGSIENAEKYFKDLALFCDKDLNIHKNNKNSLQSNLFYFRKHIEAIF
ncbi:hypothetical protein BKH42_03570 [Helicobacter sp. 13S00482-2]|uniref:RloB domain-containing protein n=1 Tax=Helicobacter sp. 13S00482-2 TaxID=1476200 RepID=UPI000BA6466D|nr:RloB domain-containing protein [Helicobacter sp. 13S00482-2]PAF53820.1 hypothetical protein BKH42_03570 [Helicobacter sp. 13S00482-2]